MSEKIRDTAPIRGEGLDTAGYYDRVYFHGSRLRHHWHWAKFQRVHDIIASLPRPHRVLDFGCAAGTFLGSLDRDIACHQIGIDIDANQIAYAKRKYANEFRQFSMVQPTWPESTYTAVTAIEVIEHMTRDEIANFLHNAAMHLVPGGHLIITTPNYASLWPLIEMSLVLISKIPYDEQHLTKFTAFNITRKLSMIDPNFRENFSERFVTTSHLLTPWLSILIPTLAKRIARNIACDAWKNPFGSLVVACYTRAR